MPTIAGNVGGAAGSGALIQLRDKRSTILKRASADGSGNFTFTVADEDTYLLEATLSGFRIRQKYEVVIKGGNNVEDVTFTISALNAAS